MLHHKLSVTSSISMDWLLPPLLFFFFFISNLWISILKEARAEAARDPRRCLFALLLLKLLLLQKCNKFPCNDVQGRLIFSSLLLLPRHLKKTEDYTTERVFFSGHSEMIVDGPSPHDGFCVYGRTPTRMPQVASFHSGPLPGKRCIVSVFSLFQ